MRLLVVCVVRWLPVEACHRLGHTRYSDLARGLDALLVQLGSCHFCLDVASVAEVMLVHIFCIFI